MTYCIIADFFRDTVARGSELCMDAVIELLRPYGKVTTKQSHLVTPEFIRSNDYRWIVSNRQNLSEEAKAALPAGRYIVAEHDCGWTNTRDFGLYEDFIPPADHIINRSFYENAEKVVMQSSVHAYAIKQALNLTNVISAGGNAWSKADIALLRELVQVEKTESYAVVSNSHESKGTDKAIALCQESGHPYKIIPEMPREQFLRELAKYRFLVFLPQIFESYCRLLCEFKAMGGTPITNGKSGFRNEAHACLWGTNLIDHMEANNKYILELYK